MMKFKWMVSFMLCGLTVSAWAGEGTKVLAYPYDTRPADRYFEFGGPGTRFEPVGYKDITGQYPEADMKGLKTISYEAFPSDAKKTRPVFAYLGIPDGPVPKGGFPAIVFGHGGWGCASSKVVDYWKARGFVAVSMSCEGAAYARKGKMVKLKEFPGFPGYGNYRYHPALYVRANSLLRGLPMVDKDRIAYIGQSWGGVKGAVLACIDDRFKCMAMVSSGGFWQIGDDSLQMFKDRTLLQDLDPAWYIAAAKVPVYWLNGTNDRYFGAAAWQQTVAAMPSTKNQLMLYEFIHARMPTGTLDRLIEYELKGGVPVPKLGPSAVGNNTVSADIIETGKGIKSAVLCYTTDKTSFQKRKWHLANATVKDHRVSAPIPAGAVQYFLAVFDETGDFDRIGRENGDYTRFCGGSSTVFTLE